MGISSDNQEGTISSGVYAIRNVKLVAYVDLKNNNVGTPITSTTNKDAETLYWNVKRIESNGHYTITNTRFPSRKAYCSVTASAGVAVTSQSDVVEWVIQESKNVGQYYISPASDVTLYCNLENNTDTTSVKLLKDTSEKSLWSFYLKE